MDRRTFATQYGGGGIIDQGFLAAGWRHLWSIEIDPQIAAVARANGLTTYLCDACATDYTVLPRPGHLHSSPPCINASAAKTGSSETVGDYEIAGGIVRAIQALAPLTFSLENVWRYRSFESFELVLWTLARLGYSYDYRKLNAADYGIPQTRERLILLARRDAGQVPFPQPTHAKAGARGLVPWNGWLAAIADLLPDLSATTLAPWQSRRWASFAARGIVPATPAPTVRAQEARGMPIAVLRSEETTGGRTSHLSGRDDACPAPTVTQVHGGRARIVLLGASVDAGQQAAPLPREADEPAFTVRASMQSLSNVRLALLPGENTTGTDSLRARAADEPAPTVRATRANPARAVLMSNSATARGDGLRDGDSPMFTVTTESGGRARIVLVTDRNGERGTGLVPEDTPAPTITRQYRHLPRTALLGGTNSTGGGTERLADDPALTVTASADHGTTRITDGGMLILALNARCLARFQSIPDSYLLPPTRTLACAVIGNGVPSRLGEILARIIDTWTLTDRKEHHQ